MEGKGGKEKEFLKSDLTHSPRMGWLRCRRGLEEGEGKGGRKSFGFPGKKTRRWSESPRQSDVQRRKKPKFRFVAVHTAANVLSVPTMV